MLALGDISAARLLYEKAAQAGDARAATGVGKTYDPDVLRRAGTHGIEPSVADAAAWYRQAAERGDPEAAGLLQRLGQ